MKKILSLISLSLLICGINAQTVRLKITYKDYPVQNSDITIKIGDASIGKGRTDNDGEVSISCSNLITKSIDVYGSKTTSNSTKTWDVKGYVNLDGNNFYHLKMEVFAKEMSEASGGFLSESAIAAGWGLAASGNNDSPTTNNSGNSSSSNDENKSSQSGTTTSKTNDDDDEKSTFETAKDLKQTAADMKQMQEDNLKIQQQNLQQDIIRFEKKIIKDDKEIQKASSEGKSINALRRMEIDKQIDVLTLEKKNIQLQDVNAKVAKTDLPFEQKKANELRLDKIKDEIEVLKEEDKKLKKIGDEPEKVGNSKTSEIKTTGEKTTEEKTNKEVKIEESKEEVTLKKETEEEAKFQAKNKQMLKLDLTELKVTLKKKNLNFKIQSGAGTQKEEKMTELKQEIVNLEFKIIKYEKRIEELEKAETK